MITKSVSKNPLYNEHIQTTSIAIVECNKVIRDNVAKFISFHEEFELSIIEESVESFLHKVEQHPNEKPDLLLLGIRLPDVSGVEGIPLIIKKLPGIDIITLSTYEEKSVILKALCAGACSYLSKKVSLDEIVEAIRIVVNEGAYMSPSIAREIQIHLMNDQESKAIIFSDKQKEIIQLLAAGKTIKWISKALFLSVEAIHSILKNLYKTLHANNKSETIEMYFNRR